MTSPSGSNANVFYASDGGDFQDNQFDSLLGGTRQRRIGGNQPYRDDPNAPQSSSFPQQQQQQQQQSEKKSNSSSTLPCHKRCYNSCLDCLRRNGCSGDFMMQQEGPQGMYYRDDFNDSSWSCRMGTSDEDGIWMNTSDQAGTIMACLVWLLLVYSAVTVTFLASTGGIPITMSILYCILCALALASHAKTTLTDPGSVPISAVPTELQRRNEKLSMCSQCQTYKPKYSHHCRICNRCISRMDHHCPWMNNCVGAANLKHFLLFLIYTWTCSVFSLALLGWNYFFCDNEECMFNPVLTQLVRIMTLLSIGAFLFTSSMLMNVCYGLMTGIGTIDRLKKKATNTMIFSEEEPVPLQNVFGIAGYHTWPFPIDPVFEDYDVVMGFSTPQRLLREQMRENNNPAVSQTDAPSVGFSLGSREYIPV